MGTLKPQSDGPIILEHWPLTGVLLHLVQRGGAWAVCGPAQAPPCCTVPNVTASVPTSYYVAL